MLCRRENAHPGAQLRFTDVDGHRFQVFLTDQPDPDIARLELRHRQRARVEDRIRAAKATGPSNLPFDRWRGNAVWLYGGHPRVDDRACLAGIVYQLRTGIPWRLLPTRQLGCGSPVTCWRRLRD